MIFCRLMSSDRLGLCVIKLLNESPDLAPAVIIGIIYCPYDGDAGKRPIVKDSREAKMKEIPKLQSALLDNFIA